MTEKCFIEKANKKHTLKYDYSKVKYTKCTEKVCIICPTHGEFWQVASDHLSGCGCPKCYYERSGNTLRKNVETFINEAREIHGDKYNYSKVHYVNANNKVCIICPEHGEFWMAPSNHIRQKQGCPLCGNKNKGEYRRNTTEGFIEAAKKVHGEVYDYSKVEYHQNKQRVEIVCPIHGSFFQRPNDHLNGSGCPECGKKNKSEKGMCALLKESFPDLLEQYKLDEYDESSHPLILDAYIPSLKVGIEYQGRQHFIPLVNFGGEEELEKTRERDERKYEMCKNNGIRLFYYTKENKKFIPSEYFDKIYQDINVLIKEINKATA